MTQRFSYIESLNNGLPVDHYLLVLFVTLETAVAPVAHLIANVLVHAITAKEACQLPDNNLTCDESASIYFYTMETGETSVYCVLNCSLGASILSELERWFLYLKLLHTAFCKLPSERLRVCRGIREDITSE